MHELVLGRLWEQFAIWADALGWKQRLYFAWTLKHYVLAYQISKYSNYCVSSKHRGIWRALVFCIQVPMKGCTNTIFSMSKLQCLAAVVCSWSRTNWSKRQSVHLINRLLRNQLALSSQTEHQVHYIQEGLLSYFRTKSQSSSFLCTHITWTSVSYTS